MRTGIITGEYPPMEGGISNYTRILAEKLADAGETVFVLTSHLANEQVRGVQLSATITQWRHTPVKKWAAENRLDIVNLHYQTAAYHMSPWIHFLPDVLDTPLVTTFHDLRFPYLFPKAGPLRPWIVRHLARTSSAAVTTNAEDQRDLQRSGVPDAKLIPLGINITDAPASSLDIRAAVGAGTEDYLIGHFGFVNHSKGLDVLLNSVAALRKNGIPARLVMIGGRAGSSDPTNQTYIEQIDKHIARLGLDVHWTGFVDAGTVRAYLAGVDVLALPFRDGASYRRSSLVTALSAATSIVTTTPAIVIPAFVDGGNMRLVPPDDEQALTAALSHLYNNPSLRHRLGLGAQMLSAQFRWPQIIASYTDLFRRLTEDSA